MRIALFLSHVARWLARQATKSAWLIRQHSKRSGLSLALSLLLVSLLFSACSSSSSNSTSLATPTSSTSALDKISWCEKPLMIFRDEGAVTSIKVTSTPTTGTSAATSTPTTTSPPRIGVGTPQSISDWTTVKTALGFTVYLPMTLPNGSCLVSAQATIHDPIFGGTFVIGYLLPNHFALSISEAPLKTQDTTFMCNAISIAPTAGSKGKASTPTPTLPSQLCSGAKDTTNIVISGPGTVAQLQQIFTYLQADVNWIPAS